MIVRTISPDDGQTADAAGSTASSSLTATSPHADLLRSASPLTASTLWSMIEADTESVLFLAEGGGEVPMFEPEEALDDAVVAGRKRALPPE